MAVALAPTRELAKQVLAAVKRALRGGTETAILVAGGAGASSRPEQADALRSAHFVVATPGRLADLASSNLAPRLNDASILILDEAGHGYWASRSSSAPCGRAEKGRRAVHGDVPGQAAGRNGALGAIVDRDGARQRVEGRGPRLLLARPRRRPSPPRRG